MLHPVVGSLQEEARQGHTGRGYMEMEQRLSGTPRAPEHWQRPEAGRGQEGFFPELLKGPRPC